jgi:hypothetical protein
MTVFERPSDATAELKASAREAALRAAQLRDQSSLRQDRCEELGERFAARQARIIAANVAPSAPLGSAAPLSVASSEEPLAKMAPAGQVALVDLHPDLVTGLETDEVQAARNALRVPVVSVAPGRCELGLCAEAADAHGQPLGAVIVEGLLIGETWLAGQVSAQIHGPGDLLNPNRDQDGSLATIHRLLAPAPAALAILDDRFLAMLRRWPQLAGRFLTQAMCQADRAGEHQAISQLPRVEDRLVALFWHLADRRGRVCADGVVVDLQLTHETIGHLIGARRPTVTLGLRALAGKGLLQRRPDGKWLLAAAARPFTSADDGTPAAALVSVAEG